MADGARWRYKYNTTARTRGRHFLLGPGAADCAPTPLSGSPGHMQKNTYNRNLNVWRFIAVSMLRNKHQQ